MAVSSECAHTAGERFFACLRTESYNRKSAAKARSGLAARQPANPGIPMASANHAFGTQANPPVASWSTGLCGCFDDVGSCCLTFFCPCVTFGRIAEIVDQGAISCCVSGTAYLALVMAGLGCLYSCCYRSKLRAQYGLKEKPCADCCVHYCCEICALCQEYRELKSRGFDMTIGWHANMERMGKGAATMAPQMHPGMTR